MHFCTAVSMAELARARLLAESLSRHHPGAGFTVLVTDDIARSVEGEPFDALGPDELGVECLEPLSRGCGPRTLALALRPWLLSRLLEGAAPDPVVWLCPEACVYAPLDELAELSVEHETVATPGGERLLALGGGGRARSLLPDWTRRVIDGAWRLDGALDNLLLSRELDRLRDATPADPDVAAALRTPPPSGLGEAHILAGAGWAAGPEALTAGPLEIDDAGKVKVGNEPLRVFDFRELPGELGGPVAELAARYAADLERHGHSMLRDTPFGHGVLARGDRLGQRLRREAAEAAREGAVQASLLCERGAKELLAWLREPAPEGGTAGVNRFHYGLYRDHLWMRRYYPQLDTGDAPRLLDWVRGHGREEIPIPDDLLPQPAPDEELRSVRYEGANTDLIRGVNLVGFLHAEFGLGEAARLLVRGLDARRIPVLPLDATLSQLTSQRADFTSLPVWTEGFPVNLLCVNGNLIPGLAEDAPWLFRDRHTIAVWFWEANRLPEEWVPAFEYLDEVWVASSFMAERIGPASPVPVRAVPLPVSLPPTVPFDRRAYGIPEDDYLFLFVFDWHSSVYRKNPHGLIEAFTSAFPPDSGASLLIKSIQGIDFPTEFAHVALSASRHPNIHLVDRHVPRREKNAIIAGCDCYVSLHRSEGFGLTIAEAMWLGKPAIATAFGGNLEFMTPQNGRLIPYTTVPIGEDAAASTQGTARYPADAVWADPDVDAAAEAMRWAFENREPAAELGRRGARDIRRAHSPDVSGETIERALVPAWAAAAARGSAPRARNPAGWDWIREGRSEQADAVRGLLTLDPVPQRPDAGGLRRRARSLLSRVLRPYASYQRKVDAALLGAVDDLIRQLAELEADVRETRAGPAAERAALFAEVRRVADRIEEETGALRKQLLEPPERRD
jgi:glycosyltransferase involved in cell wall biosynthesis